jgi:NH3-dependent NAD+ synthetase
VALPSRYTSSESSADAAALALKISLSKLIEISIEPIFQSYLEETQTRFRRHGQPM